MRWRRAFFSLISAGLGLLLIVILVRATKIDWRTTLRQLRSVSWIAFSLLVFLNAVLVYLSTLKWRSVDAALRRPSDLIPSRSTSFAITSIGMAIGLLLPVQVGMTIARTLGTYSHGGAFRRGTAGTLMEQGFDVLIVFFLATASAVTWAGKGSALIWFGSAGGILLVALILMGPLLGLARSFAASDRFQGANPNTRFGNLLRTVSELGRSELMSVRLARKLFLISTLRFGVVVLMTAQTAHMIGASIPLWQFAAAVPFVVVTTVIAVTPGGLGVNEMTSVTALRVFGTPLSVAADWALANRILASAACFALAICASLILLARKTALGSPARG